MRRARNADARDQWTRLDTKKANKKLNMDISADATGRTGAGCRKRQRRAAQTREINGHGLTRKTERKKRTKKLNTDISARRGAGKKRSGPDWQALAERAASEAKFVLIAERKKQEEA